MTAASVRTGPGLEFLPGVLIDQHFAERGRLNRLLSAVACYPHELGLGIDEDTAILTDGDTFEVLGSGAVTVVDAGGAADIRVPSQGPIALAGACVHVLPAGYTFHADWFGAWDNTIMGMWMDNCINKLLSCSAGDLGNGKMMKQFAGFSWTANPRLVPAPQ